MIKTEMLVFGKKENAILPIIDLLNNHQDWVLTTASNDEEAIEKFHQRNFDMVVLAGDINNEEERKLRKIFTLQNPDIIILKQQNDNDNFWGNEIIAALDKQRHDKRPSFSFVDDALKNAGLNIHVQ